MAWLHTEFQPLTLAVPDATIRQLIDNAVRYWNTHSGRKISGVYTTGEDFRIQLHEKFKQVVTVYPTASPQYVLTGLPTWSLLNIYAMPSQWTDLVMLSETYKMMKQYLGATFTWKFEMSTAIDEGGYLYYQNLPSGNGSLLVVGTQRITQLETIDDQYIQDWVLEYSKALLLCSEGNIHRKAQIAGMQTDGQQMVTEGMALKDKLQEQLILGGRWVALAKRR